MMVVNTGYSTKKGRIIRKILHPIPQNNDLFINVMKQALFFLVIMLCAYLAFYHYMFDTLEDRSFVIIVLLIFILQSIPAILPIFINFSYSILLLKLKNSNVMGLKS
jgi:magnesium-transporting ATPase (P-type)